MPHRRWPRSGPPDRTLHRHCHGAGDQGYTFELAAALDEGQNPPFGGLHDVRLIIRRAAIGTMLTAEQLLEVAETLTCTGAIYRFRMRLDERHAALLELLSGVDDLGTVAKSIGGCIDGRAHVLDGASPPLAAVRQKLFDLDERVKAEVRRLLRDPKVRDGLSYLECHRARRSLCAAGGRQPSP
ncbi:MAG: hypothetical protein U0798_17170 [Gemmataceae bacterium]